MEHNLENGVLTLTLEGHIDSANAGTVERAINDLRAAAPADTLVLDCEKLEYISSAGLRVLLRTSKAVPDTRLINVSPEIYEILDMTGFTEILSIRKAYRVISVEGCEVIGRGANGKVYRIDRDTVVKAYLRPDALADIHNERELARKAFVLGVPTAIPYDVVRIESGGYGSVFELVNAKSFAGLLISGEKTVDEVARMSVELLRIIHSTVVSPDSMPSMRKVALGWAEYLKDYLEPDKYEKLHALVEAVPEDNHLLHGDFHIKNITRQGDENLILDMDTLCHGHPVFELASMFNAYKGYAETDHSVTKAFLGIDYAAGAALWEKTLRLYLNEPDEQTLRAVEEKAMVVGYTRIMRRRIRRNGFASEEGCREIETCRNHLNELLPRVDSLTF